MSGQVLDIPCQASGAELSDLVVEAVAAAGEMAAMGRAVPLVVIEQGGLRMVRELTVQDSRDALSRAEQLRRMGNGSRGVLVYPVNPGDGEATGFLVREWDETGARRGWVVSETAWMVDTSEAA